MDEYIPIITAVIALIGTVIGLIFGYRKWRKEQHAKKLDQFNKDRQESYKDLWNCLEDFNIKVRIEGVDNKDFFKHRQNLNAFLLKKGIYIDEEDIELSNKYAEAVFNFQEAVKESNNQEAKSDFQGTSSPVTEQTTEIGNAQKRALKLRDELLKKIRRILSG